VAGLLLCHFSMRAPPVGVFTSRKLGGRVLSPLRAWPAFAEVRGIERSRYFRCAWCGGEWHARALHCPYCDTSDHGQLVSLVAENGGSNAAIDACTHCLRYVKTLTRLQGCPPDTVMIEDLGTVDLDVARSNADTPVRQARTSAGDHGDRQRRNATLLYLDLMNPANDSSPELRPADVCRPARRARSVGRTKTKTQAGSDTRCLRLAVKRSSCDRQLMTIRGRKHSKNGCSTIL